MGWYGKVWKNKEAEGWERKGEREKMEISRQKRKPSLSLLLSHILCSQVFRIPELDEEMLYEY